MNNKHNVVLRGGPADDMTMYVSDHAVGVINYEHNDALHRYAISGDHEQVGDSMLLVYRCEGVVQG